MKKHYIFLFIVGIFINVYCDSNLGGELLISDLGIFTYNYNGSKNNLIHNYGAAGLFYDTNSTGLEPYPWQHVSVVNPIPTYKDIYSLPCDGPRPNARDISNELSLRHNESDISPTRESMFSTIFGQFINHDIENNAKMDVENISSFPLVAYFKNTSDYACLETEEFPLPHPFRCGPDDPIIIAQVKQSRGEFDENNQFHTYNGATSFFDLSQVYSNNKTIGFNLRTKTGGKLHMRNNVTLTIEPEIPIFPPYEYTFNDMLPDYATTGAPVNQIYHEIGDPDTFLTAGDDRVNENIALSFFHTVFAREHNKICDDIIENNFIFKMFPDIFDDIIFTLARSINVHQYQKIIYEEYFKEAFGDYFYNLLGEYESYDPSVNPTTSLAFATGAFRYGHFMTKAYYAIDECGKIMLGGRHSPIPNFKQIGVGFQNPLPENLTPYARVANAGGYENIMRGLINEVSAPNTLTLEPIMRNLTNPDSILDIAVFDIIRARYNHLPNYQRLRKVFFGDDNQHINNIYGADGCSACLENDSQTNDPLECFLYITKDVKLALQLKKLFKKVNLIDGIVGIQAEDKVEGTPMGRTGGHIIVDQFRRSRDGDRFFYTAEEIVPMFTSMPLKFNNMKEILTRTLGPNLKLPENIYKSPENYMQDLIDSC